MRDSLRTFTWLLMSVLVVGVPLAAAGVILGISIGTVREQQKAIEAKVGMWTVDSITGETEFIYGSENEIQN